VTIFPLHSCKIIGGFAVLGLAVMLASCAHESSDEFIGDWEFVNSAGEHQGVELSVADASSFTYTEFVDGNSVGQFAVRPDRSGHITLSIANFTADLELADRNTLVLNDPRVGHKIKYQRVAHFSWDKVVSQMATDESMAENVLHQGDRFDVVDASQVRCFESSYEPVAYDEAVRKGDSAAVHLILAQAFLIPIQNGDVLRVLDDQQRSRARVLLERTQNQCYISQRLNGIQKL
jgi:hypothetical protein